MKFAYTRRGGPLLDWSGPTPPSPTRAGETRSLGSLGDLHVPRPGAPEIVSGYESPHPNAALIHFGADEKAAPVDTGRLIRRVSALAAGYHGVRRNNGSIFWGLVWALAAFVSPLYGTLVPAFAMAQGFGEARPRSNPARKTKKVWLPGAKVWARIGRPKKRKTKRKSKVGKKRPKYGGKTWRRRYPKQAKKYDARWAKKKRVYKWARGK
jgi:hypothetical protein